MISVIFHITNDMADSDNSDPDLEAPTYGELFYLVSELQSRVRALESAQDCPKPRRPVKCTNWNSDQHTGSRCPETPSIYQTTRDADAALLAEAHQIAPVSNLFMKPVILNNTPVTGLIDTVSSHVLVRCTVVRCAKV